MRIKIIIAEKEPYIVNLLSGLAGVDFELIGTAANGRELSELIDRHVPDIVITEVYLPQGDGIDVARIYKDKYVRMDFIFISDSECYESAVKALRVGANDFLVKPLAVENLLAALRRAVSRQIIKITHVHDYDYALRSHYLGNLASIINMNMTIENANLHYGTRYSEGAFQGFFVKIDCPAGLDWFHTDVIYSDSIKKIYLELVSNCCYDVLFETKIDGIFVILNYKPSDEGLVLEKICESHALLKKTINPVHEVTFTICVGNVKYDINEIRDTRRESFEALWTRKVVGAGDIIHWKEHAAEVPYEYRQHLHSIYERAHKACVKLDAAAMKAAIRDLFSMPVEVIKTGEIRHAVRYIISDFYETCRSGIRMLSAGTSEIEFTSKLKLTSSLDEYEATFAHLIEDMFKQLIKNTGRKETVVRLAEEYVALHYHERIRLEDVSNYLMLSRAYFSTIYTEVRNKNFFDYIEEYRIEKAKGLLKDVKMNTAQVAEMCGYTDPRYFSKVFKKRVGVTPAEYKKTADFYSG